MKKSFTIFFLSVFFFMGLSSSAIAQKFGYMNFNNLIVEMPDSKKADNEIEAYRKQLVAQLETKAKALEAKFTKYSQEAASGEITPKKNKERELELQKERDDLGALEQKLLQKIQEKRQAVYEPIFEKVDKAVKEVGKENNYTIIFNESTGVLLFNIKSDDVSPLVKAKLGM